MKQTIIWWSYQRGGWRPGSKHQKHMSINGTQYLYRFPGPKGPGPYTMKYWWTLGCFPTGMSSPFRLQEFLSSYQQWHVPVEMDEWIQFLVRNPLEDLSKCVDELQQRVLEHPLSEESRGYTIDHTSGHSLGPPLKKLEDCLGICVTPAAARAALLFSDLRERILDDLEEYAEELRSHGSTPHRRVARLHLDSSSLTDEYLQFPALPPIPKEAGQALRSWVDPPDETAADERKVIQLLTTFAEGSLRKGLYEDAEVALISSIPFANDNNCRSVVHSNVSTSALSTGEFQKAEYHAKEALLASTSIRNRKSIQTRGYQLWAASVAFQDDFEKAQSIVMEALQLYPDHFELCKWKEELAFLIKRRSYENSTRYHVNEKCRQSSLPAFRLKSLPSATGKHFDNEFCWVTFKNKLYPSKLNPSSNEMGSVFRRVGDMGSFTSTSRSAEPL